MTRWVFYILCIPTRHPGLGSPARGAAASRRGGRLEVAVTLGHRHRTLRHRSSCFLLRAIRLHLRQETSLLRIQLSLVPRRNALLELFLLALLERYESVVDVAYFTHRQALSRWKYETIALFSPTHLDHRLLCARDVGDDRGDLLVRETNLFLGG